MLGDVVSAFRSRQSAPLDWIPMVWAAIVFAWQMQFLWAIYELQSLIDSWSAAQFLLLLILALLLFVAGALVVPSVDDETTDAWAQFQSDGRWTLAILASYFFLADFINVVLFGLDLWAWPNLQDLALGVFLVCTLAARGKRAWGVLTLIFGVWSVLAIVLLSPARYG